MKSQIKQLIRLFSKNENISINYVESWDFVDVTVPIILDSIPNVEIFLTNFPLILVRNSWEFKVLDEYGDTILIIHSTSGELTNFDEIEAYRGLPVSIKFIISKNMRYGKLSIYNIDYFKKYLSEGSLYSFFNALNKRLEGTLILECINDNVETLNTASISVISKDESTNITGISDRVKRIQSIEGLIHWGTYKLQLLPEDIYSSNDVNPLYNIFSQASACLLMMYLFDHIAVNSNTLILKLCGFKSLNYTIDTIKLSTINIDKDTITQLFQIYSWCMSSGHIVDKFSIARNILSLNLGIPQVRITSPIIDAIKSNFRIFEKENVQQYIRLRNEISNLLIDLQTKINDIAQNFTSDFKSNLLVLVSFFTSVIVLGVISEASPLVYFSNQIIMLSWCFLLISFFYWLYSYNELKKKTQLFHKHYKQIKERYRVLLDDVELSNVFEECNPDKYGAHQSYIEWQRIWFSILWIASIIILFVGLSILFIFNNISVVTTIKTIMTKILYAF